MDLVAHLNHFCRSLGLTVDFFSTFCRRPTIGIHGLHTLFVFNIIYIMRIYQNEDKHEVKAPNQLDFGGVWILIASAAATISVATSITLRR